MSTVSRSGILVPAPYHFSGLPGSKASFLDVSGLELIEQSASTHGCPQQLTRRDVIKSGIIVTGAALCLQPRKAGAAFDPISAVFGALIIWAVKRIMDELIPPGADLGIQPLLKPRPTGNAFHDGFAPPCRVTNQRYWQATRPCGGYGDFGLKEYTELVDLNELELQRAKLEEEIYDSAFVPTDRRLRYDPRFHKETFDSVRKQYYTDKLPPLKESNVLYTHNLRDKNGKERGGLGVEWGGKKRFLLE